jgi:hypothetical protein
VGPGGVVVAKTQGHLGQQGPVPDAHSSEPERLQFRNASFDKRVPLFVAAKGHLEEARTGLGARQVERVIDRLGQCPGPGQRIKGARITLVYVSLGAVTLGPAGKRRRRKLATFTDQDLGFLQGP